MGYKTKEERNEYIKNWRLKNLEEQRGLGRKKNWRRYGITDIEQADLLWNNATACDICGLTPEKLCVDHCHKTNKIRGILCTKCNQGLGLLNEDPELLRKAADYVILKT